MNVAFDKIGAGLYSDELVGDDAQPLRDQPMLEEMTRPPSPAWRRIPRKAST